MQQRMRRTPTGGTEISPSGSPLFPRVPLASSLSSRVCVCVRQNAYYAKVGGVPCNEINSLEVEFLFMCNFTLFVTTDTYSQYYTELCNHAVNTANVCSCSQGPKVPSLLIPYVNAPGPGQTLTEWQTQSSSSIPYRPIRDDGSGVDMGEMSDEAIHAYLSAQQQQIAQEQAMHQHQHSQQQYAGGYQQQAASSSAPKHQQQQQQQHYASAQYSQQQHQHDQQMG
jgi:hypothetical protein